LRDAVLLTVGDVEDADLADELSALGDRWHSVEWLEDVAPALLACDVLCLPTHREGFPNVVLEAAAAGRPTVTTTATGARDSVIDGVTGFLVPVGAPTGLAKALAELAADPALRERLGAAARVRAVEDFAPADVWRGLEAVYRSPGND
jgi:glycosyltransferase involved in cell wall biosynthesis